MERLILSVFLVVLVCTVGTEADTLGHSTSHFQQWYPQYGKHFEQRLRDNCSAEYEYMLVTPSMPDCLSCYIEPVVSCLLDNSKELEKSVMAAAGVVLGLLPTTMVFMGSNTVETGLLAIRRPFLALILSAASPSISPLRPFDYRAPEDLLESRKDVRSAWKCEGVWLVLIALCQYALAFTALGNIIQNTYELTHRVVFAISVETDYNAGLWLGLAVIVHCIGMATLMLRVKIKPTEKRSGKHWVPSAKPWTLLDRFRWEWVTCASQPRGRMEYRHGIESYGFLFWSWLTSIGTVMFIIYGSCMFASVLFISLRDAIWVAVRYLISVVICRMILAYELSGMRTIIETPGEVEKHGLPLQRVPSSTSAFPMQTLHASPNKKVADPLLPGDSI